MVSALEPLAATLYTILQRDGILPIDDFGLGDAASNSHLDLRRAPYVLYGVKYIDLVSLSLKKHVASDSRLDLRRAPYVLYGVNTLT